MGPGRAQLGDGDLADYFIKMAHEVTTGHRKEGRTATGRTPMQLLGEAVDTYEESRHGPLVGVGGSLRGPAALTWSTGRRDLRAFAGLGRERATRRSPKKTRTPTSGSPFRSTPGDGS